MTSQKTAIFWTILAAGLYALNAPVSKLLLEEVPPTMMAALLYLGAGIGLAVVRLVQRMTGKGKKEAPLTKKDMPYTIQTALVGYCSGDHFQCHPFRGGCDQLYIFLWFHICIAGLCVLGAGK